jgi:hypothetical protein
MKQHIMPWMIVLLSISAVVTPLATRQKSSARTQSTTAPVQNYEECVKAGYPTGRSAGQERCWLPTTFRIFVKDLKPTIRQGIYGTITLRTGNCMPRLRFGDERDKIPPTDPCAWSIVDRQVNIMQPIEAPNSRGPYPPRDLVPLKVTQSFNGFYEIALPAGKYSVFVEDNGKKLCSWGGDCQITIGKDMIWEHNIRINHASD